MKELRDLIDELVRNEREKDNHIHSSLEPQRNRFIFQEYEHLDTLARLILGKENVCTAVCYYNGQLLCSSNRGIIDADNFLELLQRFINDSRNRKNTYLALVEKVIKKTLEVDSSRIRI